MLEYSHLIGGFLTCQIPYLIMIAFGWFFAKQNILHKEGTTSLAKLLIEIFIPIYFFINVSRSTSVVILEKNFLIIISIVFQIIVALIVSFIYVYFSKMDIRYRFTWILLNCFGDIKLVHNLIVNSFCYHLTEKTISETEFCSTSLKYNFVHMFFQGVVLWYVAFNLIRVDGKYTKQISELSNELYKDDSPERKLKTKFTEEERIKLKGIYDHYKLNVEDDKNLFKFTQSFYQKIIPFYEEDKKKWHYKMIYVMLRPPIIAMFTGFIVGFITPIQTWIFTTTNAVYLFYDTFNSIGNSHVICSYLIIGANLYNPDVSNSRFSRKDIFIHLLIKSLIMPFFGVIFAIIAYAYIPDNKVLIFTAYLQWVIPTTIDIVSITQAKDVCIKDICICITIQWILFFGLSNFISLPAFLKTVNLI